MPSENPENLTHPTFFHRITSCFHSSNHNQQLKNHGDTAPALSPSAVEKPLQFQYSEESSSGNAKDPLITLDDRQCCSICLVEFTGNGNAGVKVLPRCGHAFHVECIDEWLPSRSLNCPVCRDQAVDDEKLIGKPVRNGVLNPAAALALALTLGFSSMYPPGR